MKSGDTLTLISPPELTGFNRTIPLNDGQGNNFGTCQVSAGNVVCTFNDMVEKLHNIKGYFNFTVQAANVGTNQTKKVETNLGTTVAKQTVTITGPTSGGGTGSKQFFSKVGDIQPDKSNEVRWFLNINSNKEYLGSDILVSDSLQEGQTLNTGSFQVTIENSSIGRATLSLQEFEAKGYGRIEVTSPTSFKVGIYKDKAHATSFVIYYATTITESGKSQESFKNDYKIDYKVMHKDPVSESGSAKVTNITSDGGAQGDLPPKGTLRIVKHLGTDEEKVISDVSFKLYKESGEQFGDVYTTDKKGIIEIPNLEPGKYYVQEVSAPEHIDFDPHAKVEFEVKSDVVNGVKLPISNKVKTTSISGTKTWKDNNATDRPTMIKVDLLQNGQKIDTKEVTKENGWKYEFKDLAAYDANGNKYSYEVEEQPVDGYKAEVNGYDITNTKEAKTKVEGTKTWKDDNATDRPTMIKVDLFQNSQKIDTKEVTKENDWKYEFKDLAAYDAEGKAYKYEVKEQPVAGYKTEVNGYDITNTKIKDETVIDPNKEPSTNTNTEINKETNTGTNTKLNANTSTEINKELNTNTNNNSKVSPIKENDKTTVLLPKTGGAPTEMLSIVGGMILFVLGGILFARQRIK